MTTLAPMLGQRLGEFIVRIQALVSGTWAIKALVYAYAMWISPRFCLHVIKAYDRRPGRIASRFVHIPPSVPHPVPRPVTDEMAPVLRERMFRMNGIPQEITRWHGHGALSCARARGEIYAEHPLTQHWRHLSRNRVRDRVRRHSTGAVCARVISSPLIPRKRECRCWKERS